MSVPWTKVFIILTIITVIYFTIYVVGFDKRVKAYNEDYSKVEFRSSPKWIEDDLFLRGVTRIGRRSTLWNYVFFPAEWIWYRFCLPTDI